MEIPTTVLEAVAQFVITDATMNNRTTDESMGRAAIALAAMIDADVDKVNMIGALNMLALADSLMRQA